MKVYIYRDYAGRYEEVANRQAEEMKMDEGETKGLYWKEKGNCCVYLYDEKGRYSYQEPVKWICDKLLKKGILKEKRIEEIMVIDRHGKKDRNAYYKVKRKDEGWDFDACQETNELITARDSIVNNLDGLNKAGGE